MQQMLKILFFRQLASLSEGKLILITEENKIKEFGMISSKFPIPITLEIRHSGFYKMVVFKGTVGAAESFALGYWKTENLTLLFQLFLYNQPSLRQFEKKLAKISLYLRYFAYKLKKNTLGQSKKNILSHYDLSNDYFSLFLDSRLMYSSAIFQHSNASLEEAAAYKLDYICQKLELNFNDSIIEIGSGWGGFAIHAAQHYGCHVTTTTISNAQFELAQKKIRKYNLESKITLLNKDYRLLPGTAGKKNNSFDKLVSIEMIEAIGHEYYGKFFETCNRLLKPGGKMLLQAITIQDQQFERAKNEVDFIKQYIFPGSCIPSVTSLLNAMTKNSLLKLFHLEDIGQHYAKTLRLWRERLLERRAEAGQLGFDQQFLQMWEFYFSYCEAGFLEGYLSDVQMINVKSDLLM